MALLVAEYDALMEAKGQNEWLMEQLRLLKKKQSGASSEQTKEPLDGQMSLLFNEAEAYTAPPGPQKTTQVPAHTRKQSGSVKDAVPDNIPGPDRDAHFRHCSPASQSLFNISTCADWRVDFLSSEAKSRSNPDGL